MVVLSSFLVSPYTYFTQPPRGAPAHSEGTLDVLRIPVLLGGRAAAVRHAGDPAVRLWLPRPHSLALPRRTRPDRPAHRPVADHDPARRRAGFAADHGHGGSRRSQMDADRRGGPDGGGRGRLPLDRRFPVAGRRGDHRRHQSQRQRGRAVPGHRTGGPGPGGDGGTAHARVRLVQPDRLAGHRLRRPAVRSDRPGVARLRWVLEAGKLPRRPLGLRRRGCRISDPVCAAFARRRGPCAPADARHRAPTKPSRPAPFARRGVRAGGAVRPRRLRRRLRDSERDGGVVSDPFWGRRGHARRHFLGRQLPGRLLGPGGRRRRPPRRPAPNDGLYPRPVERPADPRALDAQPAPGRRGFIAPFRDLSNGRARPPVVHGRPGQPRRTLGRSRRDRRGAHRRRVAVALPCRFAARAGAWRRWDGRSSFPAR